MFERVDEVIVFFVAVAVFSLVIEFGFRLGRGYRIHSNEVTRKHIAAIQTSLLGLLALLLGFNFAMAASRFDARKTLIQEEVNAIGTTFLRIQLLPQPRRGELSELLRSYLTTRVDFRDAGDDDALMEAANAKSSRIESQIWRSVATDDGGTSSSSTLGLLVLSLNDMIGLKWKRRSSFDNHVPEPVICVLFIVSMSALGFMAYGYGLAGPRMHKSTALFAVLIALVLALILDLDRPRSGFIRVKEDGLLRLKEVFNQDADGSPSSHEGGQI